MPPIRRRGGGARRTWDERKERTRLDGHARVVDNCVEGNFGSTNSFFVDTAGETRLQCTCAFMGDAFKLLHISFYTCHIGETRIVKPRIV